MSDLISRQAAIDAFEPDRRRDWYTPEIIETLEDLPSAQHWIPCSERLPSEGEYVLVTEKWHGYVWMWRLQHIDDEPTWEVNGYNMDIDEAVAWMPLPKPYREEGNNETD